MCTFAVRLFEGILRVLWKDVLIVCLLAEATVSESDFRNKRFLVVL